MKTVKFALSPGHIQNLSLQQAKKNHLTKKINYSEKVFFQLILLYSITVDFIAWLTSDIVLCLLQVAAARQVSGHAGF